MAMFDEEEDVSEETPEAEEDIEEFGEAETEDVL